MSIYVPKEILTLTTKCQHEFSCLESGKCGEREMCEVSYANGPYVLFLKSKINEECPYRASIGFSKVCSCPTHYNSYWRQKQR